MHAIIWINARYVKTLIVPIIQNASGNFITNRPVSSRQLASASSLQNDNQRQQSERRQGCHCPIRPQLVIARLVPGNPVIKPFGKAELIIIAARPPPFARLRRVWIPAYGENDELTG